jgi:hypothetical protein
LTVTEQGKSGDRACALLKQQARSALKALGVTELVADCPDWTDTEQGSV